MEYQYSPNCKQCKSNETKSITLSLFTQCHLMHTKHLRVHYMVPISSIAKLQNTHSSIGKMTKNANETHRGNIGIITVTANGKAFKAKEKKGCYIFIPFRIQ